MSPKTRVPPTAQVGGSSWVRGRQARPLRMATRPRTNTRLSSTTYDTELVKVPRRPKGQQGSTPKASRWGSRSALPPREKITIRVYYRGGAECWYEIEARGTKGRFVGLTALHDVVQEIAQGVNWYTKDRR